MRQIVRYLAMIVTRHRSGPSLSDSIGQGRTNEGAIGNIMEAIEGYIAALEDDDLPAARRTSASDARSNHAPRTGERR